MIDLQEIKINGIKYRFFCETSFPEKCSRDDNPALKITLIIDKIEDDKERKKINWEDFKNSYLAEKISDYVKNTINGHHSI